MNESKSWMDESEWETKTVSSAFKTYLRLHYLIHYLYIHIWLILNMRYEIEMFDILIPKEGGRQAKKFNIGDSKITEIQNQVRG